MRKQKRFFIVSESTEIYMTKIKDSKSSEAYIRELIASENIDINVKEYFYIIAVNQSNNTNGFYRASEGGITATVVDIRLIAKFLIDQLATGFIVFHNHPSGKLEPSNSDKDLTEKLKTGMKLLDITLLDHLIITEESYYSFADEGTL